MKIKDDKLLQLFSNYGKSNISYFQGIEHTIRIDSSRFFNNLFRIVSRSSGDILDSW